jgi:hypothetical protein
VPAWIPRLRDALVAADYTFDGVSALLGTTAHAALGRNETTPGLRRTTGGSPLETLTRLWLLQATVSVGDVDRALPGLLDQLCATAILERSVSEVAARVDLRPYGTDSGNLWVVGDLTPGLDGGPNRVGPDHVLGISPAATSLAQLTVREQVGTALDLGTGCGVQSLHLAGHVRRVVATDVNRRALWMTRLNAELNAVPEGRIDVREGSFFEPVRGESFDLIVTNPPFVISPATGERLVYRDSGLPGDEAVEHIVRTAPRHLNPGGLLQILGNWIVRDGGQPWEFDGPGWLAGSSCDAWVIERERVDVASYVELWLKDAGVHGAPDYVSRYDTWLSWFAEQGVEEIAFGWINLFNSGNQHRSYDVWPYDVEVPIAPEIAAWKRRVLHLPGLSEEALLGARLVAADHVVQETVGRPGAADPSTIVLRQQRGLRRAMPVPTGVAAMVGACDGDLTLGQIVGALQDLGVEQPGQSWGQVARSLLAEGYLVLPGVTD